MSENIAYRLLNKSLKEDRLAQVYLFTGPSSSGKISLAFAFAASILLNSKELVTEDNEVYLRCQKNDYYDFYYLDGDIANLKTQEISDLLSELSKTALQKGSKRKVYLINNINNASTKVYNQILKFIEETPGNDTYGILLSDNVNDLPATIISRCLKVPFTSVDNSESEKQYEADGFSLKEAQYLSRIYPLYQKLDFGMVKEVFTLAEVSLSYLQKENDLPYYLAYSFYPYFNKKDESVSLKKACEIYLRLLEIMWEDYLRGIDNDCGFASEKEAIKCLEIYRLAISKSRYNIERKLLLDSLAYELLEGVINGEGLR